MWYGRTMRPAFVASALVIAATGCAPSDAGHGPGAPPLPGSTSPARDCRSSASSSSHFELAVFGSGGPRGFGRAASSYVVFVEGVARILVDANPNMFIIGKLVGNRVSAEDELAGLDLPGVEVLAYPDDAPTVSVPLSEVREPMLAPSVLIAGSEAE